MEGGHEEIGTHITTQLFGANVHLDTLISTWLVLGIILIVCLLLRKNIKIMPGGLQVCIEAVFSYLEGIVMDNIGEKGKKFMPLIIGLFMFIFISNQIGLLPTAGAIKSPTADLNTTLGLALFVFLTVHVVNLKNKGIVKYLKHFCQPVIFFLPINIIEELAKPITLSFRLFGNIVAGEIVVIVLGMLVPYVIPAGWILFSLFVGLIQAFIFTMLTVSYLSNALGEEH